MPVPAAVAGAVHRPAPAGDRVREALLARVQSATAAVWAGQDAELEAEMAALEAVDLVVPAEEEPAGLAPDLYAGPPEGAWGWLADLPGPLLEEYLDATAEPRGPEPLAGGPGDGAAGGGCEFAAGGAAEH
jgi:hypothetical protein